jgi:hypothetical protein
MHGVRSLHVRLLVVIQVIFFHLSQRFLKGITRRSTWRAPSASQIQINFPVSRMTDGDIALLRCSWRFMLFGFKDAFSHNKMHQKAFLNVNMSNKKH